MSQPQRRRRGAALLEFALTLPFMLAMGLGIAEFGLLMHQSYVISRAARDACRIGSGVIEGLDPTGDQIEAAAIAHAEFALNAANIDCDALGCIVNADWYEERGWQMLEVTVTVPYQSLTNYTPAVPRQLQRRFVMLTQQQIVEED